MRSLFPSFHYSFQDFVCLFVCLLVVVTLFSHTYGFNWQILSILEVSLLCPHNLNDPNFVYYQKYYSNQPLYTLYIIQQGDMRQDSMTSRYKPSYSHGSRLSSVACIRDLWLGSKGSGVRNRNKTSRLLFLLLSSFIQSSLPYQRKHTKWVRVNGKTCICHLI